METLSKGQRLPLVGTFRQEGEGNTVGTVAGARIPRSQRARRTTCAWYARNGTRPHGNNCSQAQRPVSMPRRW